MIAFPTLLSNVILFVLLIIPGFILGKLKKIDRISFDSITNILMYLAIPFLVFAKLIQTDLTSIAPIGLLFCILFPPVTTFSIAFISSFVFPKKENIRWRVSRYCSFFSNCGFLGIPLSEVLFPNHPEVTIYISLFNASSTFVLLTFGTYSLSGNKRDMSVRSAIFSPIMAALLLGVLLSLFHVTDHLPQIVTYSEAFSSLTLPLPMLVIGVELSRLRFSSLFKTVSLYGVAALKLLVMPAIAVLLMFILQHCGVVMSEQLMAAMFIATAVPSPSSASAMAKKYRLDSEYAAIYTLGTTILCVLTLPLLYMLAGVILGW